MQCSRCGGQAPDDAAFCPFCGEILNIYNAVPPVMNHMPPVYYPPVKKNRTWLIVVAVVAYVLVINMISSVAGYLLSFVFMGFSPEELFSDSYYDYYDLSSPEEISEAYLENFFTDMSEPDFGDFDYCTSIDWESVFADIYTQEYNLPERDYEQSYAYAEEVFDEFCGLFVPDIAVLSDITVESVTVQPYTVIHSYINIFDDYFRPHGLSAVDYVPYSDIKNIHEVSLTLIFYNESGETAEIPVIVNVAEYDGYYDVITDSLFSDRFMLFALTEYSQGGV